MQQCLQHCDCDYDFKVWTYELGGHSKDVSGLKTRSDVVNKRLPSDRLFVLQISAQLGPHWAMYRNAIHDARPIHPRACVCFQGRDDIDFVQGKI